MAALFRIAVVLAIFHLARFAFAHRRHSKSSDSADSQRADSWSVSDGSSEKILIKSGVPLRGRTIHHTAWSEEEKVPGPQEDTEPQQIENGGGKFYDSWSLRKALNYILSFVYDVEDGGLITSLEANSPENSKEKLKLQRSKFDEKMVQKNVKSKEWPQTEDSSKDEGGNLSIYKKNRDFLLQTTPGYLATYFQNQDIKWFESGSGNSNNKDRSSDYQYDDNELLDEDSEYEDEFSNEYEEESAIDQEQRYQVKDVESKIFKYPESEIQKTIQNKHSYKVIGNGSSNEAENPLQISGESEEINENIHKKVKEDDIHLNKATQSGQTSTIKIKEPPNYIKVVKTPTHHSGKPAVKDRSIDNENSSIDTNLKSDENVADILTGREHKIVSEKKLSQPKKQNNTIMSSESGISTIKSSESYSASKKQKEEPLEESEYNMAYKNYETSQAKVSIESEISIEVLKKDKLSPATVRNDLQNDNNGGVISDTNSVENTTFKIKPSTLNTIDLKNSLKKEDIMLYKGNVADSSTQGYSQAKDKNRIIKTKPPTLIRQRHLQPKEQSPESWNHVQKEKSEILVAESNQGGIHADIHQQATTEFQYEKVLKNFQYDNRTTTVGSIIYTEPKIRKSKIQGKKETIHLPEKKSQKVLSTQSKLQNVRSPNKPLRENGTKHSKPKLSDIYIGLEPDENVGSYNYLLDSFEFIRVDENSRNKVKKKQDDSVHVLSKDKGNGTREKVAPVLQEPHTQFKHQSEQEGMHKSKEVFGTILEYLYKISNSSLLLSLKEYNSSET